MNCFTGSGAPLPMRPSTSDASLGEIGILLRARERKFAADDALVQQEPRMIVPRARDVLERAERSKPGNSGTGNRLPLASSHSGEGPLRIRMPWRLQIGA